MNPNAQQTFEAVDLARACLAIVDQAPVRLDTPWGGWHDHGQSVRDWRAVVAHAHNADELGELVDALGVARREVLSNAGGVAPAVRRSESLREDLLPMTTILAAAGVAPDASMPAVTDAGLKALTMTWLQLGRAHPVFEDIPEGSPIAAGLAWADQRVQITSSTHATIGLISAWHDLRAERRWLATLRATHGAGEVEALAPADLRALYATLIAGLRKVFAASLRARPLDTLGLPTRHARCLAGLLSVDRLDALPDQARALQGRGGFGRAGLVRLVEALWRALDRWRAPDATDDAEPAPNPDELGLGFDELYRLFDEPG